MALVIIARFEGAPVSSMARRTRSSGRSTRVLAIPTPMPALARAFLRRLRWGDAGGLVLLGEPTAHLDPVHAAAVRAGAARLLAWATAIVVAHEAGWEPLVDEIAQLALPASRPAPNPSPWASTRDRANGTLRQPRPGRVRDGGLARTALSRNRAGRRDGGTW